MTIAPAIAARLMQLPMRYRPAGLVFQSGKLRGSDPHWVLYCARCFDNTAALLWEASMCRGLAKKKHRPMSDYCDVSGTWYVNVVGDHSYAAPTLLEAYLLACESVMEARVGT